MAKPRKPRATSVEPQLVLRPSDTNPTPASYWENRIGTQHYLKLRLDALEERIKAIEQRLDQASNNLSRS